MDMKKKPSRLDEILGYKVKGFVIEQQKAELLFRNKAFLLDFAKLDIDFSLGRRTQQIFATLLEKARGEASKGVPVKISERAFPSKAKKTALLEFGLKEWPEHKWFFDKWEIAKEWDGDRATFFQYITAGARLWLFAGQRSVETELTRFNEVFPVGRPRVFIALDPWTTKIQISWLLGRGPSHRNESTLHEFQRKYFGFSQELKRCLSRDLCWYDLNKELKLKTVKIARAWAEKRPDELAALVKKSTDWKRGAGTDSDLGEAKAFVDDYVKTGLPAVVGAAIDRLQKAIDYLTR
jgi:hypothetical protein